MGKVDVRPVLNAEEKQIFLTFPWHIYRGDRLWVPPLLSERQKRIDPERGVFFRRDGQAEFFIAWCDGKPVGTICAANDQTVNMQRGLRDCLFGFFECVNEAAAAAALFEAAATWARERELNTLY
jgi:hypothetical protein